MAENKKSFILYCDLISTVEKLPDDTAGKLLKLILSYVNDEDPETNDLLLQIAFEPIKQQLKRDLKDWECIKQDRSNGGKIGNLKRWNLDLYNKVINNKLTLEKAEEIAKSRTVSHSDKKGRTVSQPIANIAVNDTVTVTDNVNVIKEKEEIFFPFTSEIFQASWQKWKNYRKIELSKVYKSIQSEQSALSHLENISQKNEYAALEIINQSIANQWQGLFELKKQQNGSTRTNTPNKGKSTGALELLEQIRSDSANNT